ncbi:elongation factor P [Lachnospiraceae bacterium oral taxon 500]|nr:elongation factor P [Lachnospiraceae bacterium oral taxon 500]
MAVVVQAGNLKNGISIEFEGNIYQVLEFQHVKPGKGPAFVRTKLRNMKSGSIIDKTFRPQDRFEQAVIERKDMQYLYSDGELFHFMDQESFEQIALNAQDLGDALKFVKENDVVMMLSHNGVIFGVEPPISVELTVTHTEPGIKGDTATGATKPAELETGAVVMVPLFINNGDKLKIDTRTGEYVSRV